MALLNLVFIAGFALLLPTLFHGFPGTTLRFILLLPVIAIAPTLVLAGIAIMEWVPGNSVLFTRIQYSVLAVAGMLFAIVLHIWNLIGWRL